MVSKTPEQIQCATERGLRTAPAIVASAYNTPTHEVSWAREAARGDLAAALIAYRLMAKEIEVVRK